MNKNKLLVLITFLIAALCARELRAADLHVIAVGDFAAEDLRASIVTDLTKIEVQVREIAYHTDLTLRYHSFCYGDKLPKQVLNYIRNLNVQKEDVIIFYFSGHGYRTNKKLGTPWPNLYFSSDQAGLELELIGAILQEKPAHLSIVMADCCNNILMEFLAPPLVRSLGAEGFDDNLIRSNYRKLFIESEGSVMIASSKAGQVSYCCDDYGGFYTNAFLKTLSVLMNIIPTEDLDWQFLLEQSAYMMEEFNESWGIEQDPIFNIEMK